MSYTFIWVIAFLAIAGVITRPYKVPEVVWAVSGAAILLIAGLISPSEGFAGIARGTDVYLFLTGMMLFAETAREEKLFDWLAAHATHAARGSSKKMFLLIYLVGIIVTAFLSNDATAVVLTPAVAAAVKAAKINKPVPYLLICAFIANAASFVLPISNPANLVIYGSHMPTLLHWLSTYTIPSIIAIAATYGMLYLTQRNALKQPIKTNIIIPSLSAGGKTALAGIAGTAILLLVSSAMDMQLGLPTAITGIVTSAIVVTRAKSSAFKVIKGVSWSVLPLVAGLFVIVEALNKTGLIQNISNLLNQSSAHSVSGTVWGSGIVIAFTCNLVNNLPAGLVAGSALQMGHIPDMVKSAVLIGVDLGPNLSITGSLATILWLVALRREGQNVSAWAFLKIGSAVMTVALLLTIASLFIIS
jgi:arsenical pump membrane protein